MGGAEDDPTIPRPCWELIQARWAQVPEDELTFGQIRSTIADSRVAVEDAKADEYMEFVRFLLKSPRRLESGNNPFLVRHCFR
jgi:hypothetical protein